MMDVREAPTIAYFVPPMPNGQSHHVISRGQTPKFYRPEDLKDKGPGRTPWVIAFEEIIVGLHLALGGPVPYAFRTPDGQLRSLDAGCVKMILNRTPPELIVAIGPDGYISGVTPTRELLARYAGRDATLKDRVLQATGEAPLPRQPLPLSPQVAAPERPPVYPIQDHHEVVELPVTIERALIIREPWISLIIDGQKTWEMRPGPTSVRGWIGLAAQGTGQVVGLARLIDSRFPLNARNYDQYVDQHAIPADQTAFAIENNWVYPWVLSDVIRLPRPIPYPQSPGAVKFVNLDVAFGSDLARYASSAAVAERTVVLPPTLPGHGGAVDEGLVFVFEPERAKARAVLVGGKRLRVLKGSTAMRSGSPAVKRDEDYRDQLIRQGILRASSDPELYEFTVDHEFDSASRAAGVVKDGNSSGPGQWRNPETGLTLKEYFDRGGRL